MKMKTNKSAAKTAALKPEQKVTQSNQIKEVVAEASARRPEAAPAKVPAAPFITAPIPAPNRTEAAFSAAPIAPAKGPAPAAAATTAPASPAKDPVALPKVAPASPAAPAPAAAAPASAKAAAAPPPPKGALTIIDVKLDVGYGNAVYLRGKGDGLSWERGVPMACLNANTWRWSREVKQPITFKPLLNDKIWSAGGDLTVTPGQKIEVAPAFA
jgi:hypothetical protein